MEGLREVIRSRLREGSNDIVISFCNHGFLDFVLNLVHCFQTLRIENYVIISLDSKYDALHERGIPTFHFHKEEAIYTEATSNFGEVGFKAICNEKPFLVLEVMKLGFNTLWTDSDNPFLHFKGDYDLFVQRDDDDICAGFFFIKSNPQSIEFMTNVVNYLNPMIDDQISMRRFLQLEKQMTHFVLDRVLFPNGTAYPLSTNVTPVIIHNNCIIGHDSKKDRFKLYNLWFIDETEQTCNDKIQTVESTKVLKGHYDVVTSVHAIESTLYSSSLDKNIVVWDYEKGTRIATKPVHARGAVWGLTSLNSKLFTASHDRTCSSWDINEWKAGKSYVGHSTIVNCVCISASKNMLFTGSDDETIRGYDLETGEKKKIYTGHTGWVSSVCTEGAVLFSASEDSTARAWEIASGRQLVIYKGHKGWVRSVVARGNMVFTGGNDHTVRFWSMKDGSLLRTLRGHTASVSCVCLDSEGNILYSASDDTTIRAWNVKNGECLATYVGHSGMVTSICEHKGNVFSSSFDKTIRVWPVTKVTDHNK